MSDIRAVQIEHFKKLGYQFKEKDIPFPDENELKLGNAILVDYETPIDEQCSKLGIKNGLRLLIRGDRYSNLIGHWGWIYGVSVDMGSGEYLDSQRKNRADAAYCYREGLNKAYPYRTGLTISEGLALYRENPELFKNKVVDLTGSYCILGGLSYDASFCWNDGKPEIDSNYVEIGI